MKNFLFAVQSSLTLHPNFKVELTPVWDSAGVCVQHICRHTLQSWMTCSLTQTKLDCFIEMFIIIIIIIIIIIFII